MFLLSRLCLRTMPFLLWWRGNNFFSLSVGFISYFLTTVTVPQNKEHNHWGSQKESSWFILALFITGLLSGIVQKIRWPYRVKSHCPAASIDSAKDNSDFVVIRQEWCGPRTIQIKTFEHFVLESVIPVWVAGTGAGLTLPLWICSLFLFSWRLSEVTWLPSVCASQRSSFLEHSRENVVLAGPRHECEIAWAWALIFKSCISFCSLMRYCDILLVICCTRLLTIVWNF